MARIPVAVTLPAAATAEPETPFAYAVIDPALRTPHNVSVTPAGAVHEAFTPETENATAPPVYPSQYDPLVALYLPTATCVPVRATGLTTQKIVKSCVPKLNLG